MRVSKTVDSVTTTFLQDQATSLSHVLMETTSSQDTFYVYGLGLAFQVNPDGTRRYYHTDHLGSTRVVTDDSGQAVSAFSYDPYGGVRTQAGQGKAFAYTGEEVDTETSFTFLRTRHYDPATGRFLQKDEFAHLLAPALKNNRYAYGLANPVRHTDPSGHQPELPWDLINVGLDAAEVAVDPSVENGLALAADSLAALVPGVPGGVGLLVKAFKAIPPIENRRALIGREFEEQVASDLLRSRSEVKFETKKDDCGNRRELEQMSEVMFPAQFDGYHGIDMLSRGMFTRRIYIVEVSGAGQKRMGDARYGGQMTDGWIRYNVMQSMSDPTRRATLQYMTGKKDPEEIADYIVKEGERVIILKEGSTVSGMSRTERLTRQEHLYYIRYQEG